MDEPTNTGSGGTLGWALAVLLPALATVAGFLWWLTRHAAWAGGWKSRIESKLKAAREKHEELEDRVSTLQSGLATLAASVSRAEGSLWAEIAGLGKRLDEHREDLREMRSEIVTRLDALVERRGR